MCDPVTATFLLVGAFAAADSTRISIQNAQKEALKQQEEQMKKQAEEEKKAAIKAAEDQRRQEATRFGLTKTINTSPFGDLNTPITTKKTLLGE